MVIYPVCTVTLLLMVAVAAISFSMVLLPVKVMGRKVA